MKKFLGFQLCNRDGVLIQGGDDDPTNLCTFEIMSVETAVDIISTLNNSNYCLVAVFEGEIEDPSIV